MNRVLGVVLILAGLVALTGSAFNMVVGGFGIGAGIALLFGLGDW